MPPTHAPPPRTRTQALRPAAAALLLLLCLAAGACSRETGRYAVVERNLSWTSRGAAPAREPLSRSFEFTAPDADWRAPGSDASVSNGALVLHGHGTIELIGPGSDGFDPRFHHRIELVLRSSVALELGVAWRAPHEPDATEREAAHLTVAPGQQWFTGNVALSTLPELHLLLAAQSPGGALRLRFQNPGGAEITLEIDRIRLLSQYDGPDGGPAPGRLAHDGTVIDGVALRVPGSVVLGPVTLAAGDRLRLELCVLGEQPLPVSLRARWSDGRQTERSFSIAPADGWTAQKLDVTGGAPGAGDAASAEVTLQAEGPVDARTVLLVGNALRLSPTAEGGPPILLYVEDTLRVDHLGVGGYGHPTDPRLLSIARQGASFGRVHATSSWTRPAMSSLMTSVDVAAHGNRDPARRVSESFTTLAEALADAGWLTASFVSNPHSGVWSGLAQGFDIQSEGFVQGSLPTTLTSQLLREPLLAFLAEHRDERVFVYAHSTDPHSPYMPDQASLAELAADKTPRAVIDGPDAARFVESTLGYDAEVRHNDDELAKLDDGLAALGLRDATLFMFTSDHGEAFGEHGRWEHHTDLHEEQLLVPWVLRWPGVVASGARVAAPASLLDVAPTLLGLAGVKAPAGWQGRDLSAPCRAGGDPLATPRAPPLFIDTIYLQPIEGVQHAVAVLDGAHKLIAGVDAAGAVRPLALYDLDTDPGERSNRLGDPALASVEAELAAFAAARLRVAPPAADSVVDMQAWDPSMREWLLQLGYLR